MQRRGELSLVLTQIPVARRHGQPVVLRARFGEDQPHGDLKIANHALDHRALLRVLLSENGESAPTMLKSFARRWQHRRNVPAVLPFQRRRTPPTDTVVCARPDTWRDRRQKKQIGSPRFEKPPVSRLVPRIAVEVFLRSELIRIHEDRDDDEVRAGSREPRRSARDGLRGEIPSSARSPRRHLLTAPNDLLSRSSDRTHDDHDFVLAPSMTFWTDRTARATRRRC